MASVFESLRTQKHAFSTQTARLCELISLLHYDIYWFWSERSALLTVLHVASSSVQITQVYTMSIGSRSHSVGALAYMPYVFVHFSNAPWCSAATVHIVNVLYSYKGDSKWNQNWLCHSGKRRQSDGYSPFGVQCPVCALDKLFNKPVSTVL